MDWLSLLFDTSDFPARWHCGHWTAFHGWVHIVSDLLIFGAYAAIPLSLWYFVRKREEIPFSGIFVLFGVFILSCGTVHLIEALIFFRPIYRISALGKVLTAVASWATVVALIRILPAALTLPGLKAVNAELTEAKARLETEAQDHERTTAALQDAKSRLESEARERQHALERLQETNRKLDEFASLVAHDLRGPLVQLGKLAEWLEEDLHGAGLELPEGVDESLRLQGMRVTQLVSLVEGLLAFSRVSQGKDEPQAVDTEALVRESADLLELPAGFTLETEGLPVFSTQRTPLSMVLRNLLQNAIKYHDREQGTIQVSATREGERYAFVVADDGPGIPEDKREAAFDMFKRLTHAPEGEARSSGLGLSFVRRTVEALGGTVVAGDSPLGRGVAFRFTWPVSAPPSGSPG